MKKLSDTFVNESNKGVKDALQNISNSKLMDCFLEFFTTDIAWEFIEWCLKHNNPTLTNSARKWLIDRISNSKEITMNDLEKGGWC